MSDGSRTWRSCLIKVDSLSSIARLVVVVTVLFILLATGDVFALYSGNLTGSIDITGVRRDRLGGRDESLRQQYTVNWQKRFTQYLQTNWAVRYYRLNLDQPNFDEFWREEIQPSFELVYSHPEYSFVGWYRQRRALGNSTTPDLTTDNYSLNFKVRRPEWPFFDFRYDWNRNESITSSLKRTLYDRRFRATTDYVGIIHEFHYTFSVRNFRNSLSSLRNRITQHQIRYGFQNSYLENGRLRIGADYLYSRSSDHVDVRSGEVYYREIPALVGLHLKTTDPFFGALDTLQSLIDGNVTSAASAATDIGQGETAHNFGVDLGSTRTINAIYVYTDRPSDASVTWTVFKSSDNLYWDQVTFSPGIEFNFVENRYEISFPTIDTRYIKVVNGGVNSVSTVYVTEVEALLSSTGDRTNLSQTHQFNITARYTLDEKTTTSADISYRGEPPGGISVGRDEYFYALSARRESSRLLSQTLRWQQSFQNPHNAEHLSDWALVYNANIDPLSTLRFSTSASTRASYIRGKQDYRQHSATVQAYGSPLYGLNFSAETGFSKNRQVAADLTTDTWIYRFSVDALLTRSIKTAFSYGHQNSTTDRDKTTRDLDQYRLSGNIRLTAKISLRAAVDWNYDKLDYVNEEYGIGYALTRSFNVGAIYRKTSGTENSDFERFTVQASLKISSRSNLYFNYTKDDLASQEGPARETLQGGFRSSF